MALKDSWQDKINNIDDINAEDINAVARAVISLEQNSESKIVVDNQLSTTSTNPVQNKVITTEINSLKESINGVEEKLRMINEGGIE